MLQLRGIVIKYWQSLIKWFAQFKEDKNALIFFVFLVISTGFWFLNALRKEYTTLLTYPVRFTNIPKDKLIAGPSTSELTVKVKAGGFTLLHYRYGNVLMPLSFDVNEMRKFKRSDKKGSFLLTNDYYRQIKGRLATGMELLEVNPDTLFVGLIDRKTKRVPVKGNIEVAFQKQYLQAGEISLLPDSVTISGAETLVDTIDFVSTKHMEFNELRDTLVRNIALESIPDVDMLKKRVKVIIPVEPFTELSAMVPVTALNIPTGLRFKSFPPEIKVTYHVGFSRSDQIRPQDFNAVVNLKDYDLTKVSRLKVKLEYYPEGLYYLDYSPIFIEYLLEREK
ncbi:YbbR-like domain-containing protein [Marinilabiliaceae bacterium JC017]|nr:YbbR-like domain-containing protein [Marinilabiliaceae bacterium JC017]